MALIRRSEWFFTPAPHPVLCVKQILRSELIRLTAHIGGGLPLWRRGGLLQRREKLNHHRAAVVEAAPEEAGNGER